MKKIWSILLIVLFASVLLPLSALAAGKDLIVDDMDKISNQSMNELNKYAREISDTYQMDIAFFLVSGSYSPGQSLYEHIRERYLDIQGLGPDGFALAIDIEGKIWTVVSFGEAEQIITDEIEDQFWDAYLETGETYYDGIMAYLEEAADFLANQAPGNDTENPGDDDKPHYTVDTATLAPRGNNYVVDETGTLTVTQIDILNEKAAALTEKRGLAVYIWIVDLVPEKYARTINDLEVYVDAFYARYDLGYGDDKNGMVLLLEIGDIPGERDYLLNTHGSCTTFFNNDRRERLLDDKIVPPFKAAFNDGNFYKVADTFLESVENEYVRYYMITLAIKLAIVILLPLLIALIVCSRWKAKMKTAKIARTADNYIPANGFNLTGQADLFLYRTTTRRKIERESSSSGGSSSSSSGRSSGGKV